ncbi:unnamed protein product [Clonostachys chloroleuca]|uniref:Uncharacterized protein n=1 Tax=Clonostachys chloroleuca TaxID=1926264 RepID=A0AA35QBT6_9HYPO|nr:unnamed protein product [Clonostachys chloroleuca]
MAPPSTIIASVFDVTRPMRLLCRDIIDGVIDSTFAQMVTQEGPLQDLMDSQGSFPQLEAGLWLRVFKPRDGPAWNSSLPIPDLNLPKLTPSDLRIQAGTLLVDAAPADTNRRLFPWNVRLLDPPAKWARRCGNDVFLEPRHHPQSEDRVQWFWCDRDGKAVDPRVTLVHVINREDVLLKFRRAAVASRDGTMFRHALKHNLQLGIYRIRCRLAAFAASGFSQELMPPVPSAGDGVDFFTPSYLAAAFRRELSAGPVSDPDAEARARTNAAQVLMLYKYYYEGKEMLWI